jgi:peptidyl-prolyl cis-trans isomerase A (cyclophilin A)
MVRMKYAFFRRIIIGLALAAAWLGFCSTSRAAYTNGIYAEFNTTMGSYTCVLYYASAPKAVANFVGLATGQRAWVGPTGNAKKGAFYNGTIFHRVIGDFVIQGGSPNQMGNDTPGYAFVDEFTSALRFDRFGVLAMANAGPDSNGSQFFVTAEPTPWLNDVHTIFGRLYGGSNVVYAINHVATDGGGKPLTNVVIQSLIIQRVGTAATNFDVNAQGLAIVTNIPLKISKVGTNISLTFSNKLFADTRVFASADLSNWSLASIGIDLVAPVSNSVSFPVSGSRQFFRAAQVQYPATTLAPKTVYGRTITITFTNGIFGQDVVTFNSSGGGTSTYNGSPGTVLGYAWYQGPFNGTFYPLAVEQLLDMELHLNYHTATAGSFTGTLYNFFPYVPAGNVSGYFTSSP